MKAHKIIVQKSNNSDTAANGIIGINPNKPDFGSIYLKAVTFKQKNGFLNSTPLPYYMNGTVEELEQYVESFDLRVGSNYSDEVEPSRIIITETFTARHSSNKVAINPVSKEALTSGGAEFYRYYDLVPATDTNKLDIVLTRDTVGATAGAESPFVEDTEGLSA